METSASTGAGVEEAFLDLARRMAAAAGRTGPAFRRYFRKPWAIWASMREESSSSRSAPPASSKAARIGCRGEVINGQADAVGVGAGVASAATNAADLGLLKARRAEKDFLLRSIGLEPAQLDGISIAAAGAIDARRGVITASPNLPGWHDMDL